MVNILIADLFHCIHSTRAMCNTTEIYILFNLILISLKCKAEVFRLKSFRIPAVPMVFKSTNGSKIVLNLCFDYEGPWKIFSLLKGPWPQEV